MQLLDLDHLRSFLAIVNTGSFTRAAQHVHKTQSAVSVHIRRLEETLGKPLFAKDGRNARLTPEGELLVDYAKRLLELNHETVSAISVPLLSGQIRIGTPVYAERYFPLIFASFAKAYIDVEIQIFSDESGELARKLDRSELDIALVTHASAHGRGEVICMEQLYWVTSADHRVHQLEVVPLALYHAASALRTIATDALDAVGRRYRVAYCSASNDALIGAVSAGLAVGMLPGCSLQPSLRVLNESDDFPSLPQFAIALIQGASSNEPHVKAMAEHIKNSLSTYRS